MPLAAGLLEEHQRPRQPGGGGDSDDGELEAPALGGSSRALGLAGGTDSDEEFVDRERSQSRQVLLRVAALAVVALVAGTACLARSRGSGLGAATGRSGTAVVGLSQPVPLPAADPAVPPSAVPPAAVPPQAVPPPAVPPAAATPAAPADTPHFYYHKVLNAYCQNQAVVRLSREQVDEKSCQLLCDADSRCGAAQMHQGKTDCSLLQSCEHKSRSEVGSYILVKGSSNQDLLSAALGALHESPDSTQASPQGNFDCVSQVHDWVHAWGEEQKNYCCTVYYDGCPGRGGEVVMGSMSVYPRYHMQHHGQMPFNCHRDVRTWERSWKPEKRSWCCNVYYDGCPSTSHDVALDCADNHRHWDKDKTFYCCAHFPHHHGCANVPKNPLEPVQPDEPMFNCGKLSHDYKSAWSAWSEPKQKWCCKKHSIACMEAERPKVQDTGTTTTPYAAVTTTTAFPPKFDCEQEFNCWATCWSPPRQKYCCEHGGRACAVQPTPVLVTTTTPYAALPIMAGTTQPSAVPEGAVTTTTAYGQVVQSGVETTKPFGAGAQVAPSVPSVTTKPFGSFDCFSELVSEWSETKKEYCCAHEGCCGDRCPDEGFNCEIGAVQWQSGWSQEKKGWCCQHHHVGCVQGSQVEAQPETTTTPFVELPWQQPAKENPTAPETTTTAFEVVQYPAASEPFDCNAGFARWQDGWSTNKKTWCCENKNMGCVMSTSPMNVVQPAVSTAMPTTAPPPEPTTSAQVVDLPGLRTRISETCAEALEFIQSEECDAQVLLDSIKRTCPITTDANKDSCVRWFGRIDDMSDANHAKEVARCRTAVDRMASAAEHMQEVEPANKEESELCFSCKVACRSRNKPVPAPRGLVAEFTPGNTWSPDGSKNHCRPRTADGQVAGTQIRARKEARMMTAEDWSKLNVAMEALRIEGKLEEFAQLFSEALPPEDATFLNFQQLPWFRHFLFDFETQLQRVAKDCSITLPYWAGCYEATSQGMHESPIWGAGRLGGAPDCLDGDDSCKHPSMTSGQRCDEDHVRWCLGDGLAGNWKVDGSSMECQCVHRTPGVSKAVGGSCAVTLPVLRMMEDFNSLTEAVDGLRATMHCGEAAGGESTLCTQKAAIWDPLFWFNYAYLDRIFFGWQRHHYLVNDIDTTDCYGGEMHMTYYQESLTEWFGKHDKDNACIEVPKSDPQACIYYEHTSAKADTMW